jgi:hypothetical protein
MFNDRQARILVLKIRKLVEAELDNARMSGVIDLNYREQVRLELQQAQNDLALYIHKLQHQQVDPDRRGEY